MKYETLEFAQILDWCKENNQVEWLKKEMEKKVKVEKYSERKQKVDLDGNPVLNKKGYPVYVVNKSSKKITEERAIDFMTVKKDFNKKFGKEGLNLLPADFKQEPKKKNKKTMFDLVNEL